MKDIEPPEIMPKLKILKDNNFIKALCTPNYYDYLTACEASQNNENKNNTNRKEV